VFHLGLTRAELLRELARLGPEAVLPGFTGTLAEARAAIARDPRAVFVLERTCTRQGVDGACLGHPSPRCAGCGAWLVVAADTAICPTCGARDVP
jgi:hypothetical protein